MSEPSIPCIENLSAHIDGVRAVICDLWGVMHDGVNLHSGAVDAVQRLQSASIPVVFLSNAPRPVARVRRQLEEMGMPAALLGNILTSGTLARRTVRDDFEGAKLYHMGPKSDADLIEGLPVSIVDRVVDADVILASGLDYASVDEHLPDLTAAAQKDIPFICANPDRVVHVGDQLWICAGAVADAYIEIGGSVIWTGKPAPLAMEACRRLLSKRSSDHKDIVAGDILVIGDGLPTDIAGAKAFGCKSLLVTDGIHRSDLKSLVVGLGSDKISRKAFSAALGEDTPVPDQIIPTLKW